MEIKIQSPPANAMLHSRWDSEHLIQKRFPQSILPIHVKKDHQSMLLSENLFVFIINPTRPGTREKDFFQKVFFISEIFSFFNTSFQIR